MDPSFFRPTQCNVQFSNVFSILGKSCFLMSQLLIFPLICNYQSVLEPGRGLAAKPTHQVKATS